MGPQQLPGWAGEGPQPLPGKVDGRRELQDRLRWDGGKTQQQPGRHPLPLLPLRSPAPPPSPPSQPPLVHVDNLPFPLPLVDNLLSPLPLVDNLPSPLPLSRRIRREATAPQVK